MIEDEYISHENSSLVRNGRPASKSKDGSSVTDLIPTLFDMAKIMMRIECNLDKKNMDDESLEELSKIASAIMKMTLDIEYLRRKGY